MLFACPVSAYENKVVQAENPQSTYDENIETISALGILNWDTDTFSASENVTRGEFTRLITNIVSNGVYSTDSVMSVFCRCQCRQRAWQNSLYRKKLRYRFGRRRGSFYPDRPITYEEAYKIFGFGARIRRGRKKQTAVIPQAMLCRV
ncbi:MAG: S-layer homology domain-containing protein [Clostridiales bacterium]|nr:MAG: S-layer homology domain-containing protein [Clostridiales bacterium]